MRDRLQAIDRCVETRLSTVVRSFGVVSTSEYMVSDDDSP